MSICVRLRRSTGGIGDYVGMGRAICGTPECVACYIVFVFLVWSTGLLGRRYFDAGFSKLIGDEQPAASVVTDSVTLTLDM